MYAYTNSPVAVYASSSEVSARHKLKCFRVVDIYRLIWVGTHVAGRVEEGGERGTPAGEPLHIPGVCDDVEIYESVHL